MRLPRPHGPLAALLCCIGICCAAAARAETLSAAVAANFSGAMKRLAPAFEARSGHRVECSFGASGQFYAQIRNGAPYDVLLSADTVTPDRLVGEGSAVPGTQFVYARGRLALWSATPGLVDADGAVLRELRFARLAIANPKTAPYGQAAIEALGTLGLLERVRPLLVTGENIAQAQQFVASGNVPLGLIALGQVMALPPAARGSHWLVPDTLHAPVDQGAVLLSAARNADAARAFLAFLASPEAAAFIRELGYDAPAAAVAAP